MPNEKWEIFFNRNHLVETLLPMLHMDKAGFEIDISTLSRNFIKLEMWAMPIEDKTVMEFYNKYLPKFENPLKLKDILGSINE